MNDRPDTPRDARITLTEFAGTRPFDLQAVRRRRMGTGGWLKPLAVIDVDELDWPMGVVVQEIHTGTCCAERFCDFYPPLWEMAFQCWWTRAGKMYDPDDDSPRLPVRLLWHPEWEGRP